MDKFFCVVIKAMIIALYMHIVGYSIINELQIWINKSNWPAFISKAKCKHLRIFKVYDIWNKASQKTAIIVANMFDIIKKCIVQNWRQVTTSKT